MLKNFIHIHKCMNNVIVMRNEFNDINKKGLLFQESLF